MANVKILKTVEWKDCKDELLRFVRGNISQYPTFATDFCEFLSAYPVIQHQEMLKELAKCLMTEHFHDVTEKVVAAENATLFALYPEEKASALETVVDYSLKGNVPVWCYLDCERKAVAQFGNLAGVGQAWIFCEGQENFSAAHFVEVDSQMMFIPVVFIRDLAVYRVLTETMKSKYLREYLPRQVGDLLSKKSHRTTNEELQINVHKSGIDNGDSL